MTADPFGTAALRAGVLAAWADSPTRFREDANAEEDLRLGGYAETWCVELAQNAADAAREAGAAGRVQITVQRQIDGPGELRVANTGAPLDAAGVAALAALRASAKRDDAGSVGRFGVGFAAVLALSDAPRIVTTGGGVAFSAASTVEAVRELPGPAAELARRAGQLPVLRLVWPTGADEEPPPAGYATEVRLPLRPDVDPDELLAAAAAAAPDLLLALPDLVEIDVAGRLFAAVADGGAAPQCGIVTIGERGRPARRWLLVRGSAEGAGGTAVEQRGRHVRSCRWALPLDADGRPAPLGDDVLHAPTVTTERLTLPARLIADVPLDPDRRRIRTGAATDTVLQAAADAYLDLVTAVAPDDRLGLVPAAGFPRSELDARLRALLLDALRAAAWLPGADGGEVAPRAATVLDLPAPELPALLADVVPGLLAAPNEGGRPRPDRANAALGRSDLPNAAFGHLAAALPAELGVERLGAAALADRLLGVRRPAAWWRAVYAALEPAADTVPGVLDELRALPVPLVDGRTVPGPAGVLLPGADAGRVGDLALPGLHIADPDAVHPLLVRLGARPAEPDGLLDHPALRDAVERSVDDAEAGLDPIPLAEAVLGLVAELGPVATASRDWLAALALTDVDGEPARADELMLPDAALRPLLADDAPPAVLAPAWQERVSREVLVAVGVLDGFAVVETDAAHAADRGLDDVDRWFDETGADSRTDTVVAVRDLDLVRDDAWPAALALLAGEPATRAAVLPRGAYTAWWLARHARLHGRRPGFWRLPSASGLGALYDPLPGPATADDAVLVAAGVRAELTVADARDAADLLARLADPDRRPDAALAAAAHDALAAAVVEGRVDPADLDPPERVRALDGSVADAAAAVVLDAPELAAVLPAGEVVVGGDPKALADLLDLPVASEIVDGEVAGTGRAVPWGALPEVVVTCHTLGVPVPAGELWCHDELWVVLHRPAAGRHRVPTWRAADGRRHADDPVRALLAVLGSG